MPGDAAMGDARVAVVESRVGGMQTEMHKTRLELVLAWLDSGQLGSSELHAYAASHGSPEHVNALLEVIARAGQILDRIQGKDERRA